MSIKRVFVFVTPSLPPQSQSRALQLSQPHSKYMHRCLRIQELLSIIFRYVLVQETLARLARTCTDFRDPALNELWHTQNTILPLFKCLPRDAWVIKKKKFVSNNLEIKSRLIFEHVRTRASPESLPHLILKEYIFIVTESKFFVIFSPRILRILKIKS
jgi:hypothetical protein